MKPEEKARLRIDQLLREAGWDVQDCKELNLGSSLGVAVREFPVSTGFADYLLFVDRKAAGVIEAKPEGTTLTSAEYQSDRYIFSLPADIPSFQNPLPFAYESTGVETFFRSLKDPDTRSRRVFAFHRPETLLEWAEDDESVRMRLLKLPTLITTGLRDCQIEAIQNLDISFADSKPRSLIQMATGSGKTFMAVSSVYRLIKFANARRVLFLVDRNTLGRQTHMEFQQYITPDDGRKFTELYNVQHLTSNVLDPVCRVTISTIQRLYSMLADQDYDPEIDERSIFSDPQHDDAPKEISFNPQFPIETFDFIITDECHRSIYNLWRQVLEYFDAFLIGLTATPSKQTLGFFNQNLVMEYNHERAVADGVNVGYDVYRIDTKMTREGGKVDAGFYIDKRDKLTRKVRWELLDDELTYNPNQLDRDVVAVDQIRTVVQTFRDKLFTEIFPGREDVPKTLVFAKDDSHAEDITHIIRDEFGRGNEFCKKITYKTTGEKPENLITSFRNSYYPRIAVTVDMISTGTDIRPLECLVFMRNINSRVYFEQMKGRGTRTISKTDLTAVTPDNETKTHFVIVDAVGVCENDKTDSRPLEKKKTVPFDTLVLNVAKGKRDSATLSSLAGRLARLDRQIEERDQQEIQKTSGGQTLRDMTNKLLDAIDPDKQIERAKGIFKTTDPSEDQIRKAAKHLVDEACKPFDSSKLRDLVVEVKRKNEQIIDTVSPDEIIFAGFSDEAKKKAQQIVVRFRQYMEDHKDEILALQIFYNKPFGQRKLTFSQVKELAESIQKPPYLLTPELLWRAYEQLDKSRVDGAGPQKLLTNIISLVRFALGEVKKLEPFSKTVNERFQKWMESQKKAGRIFSNQQAVWLEMIKDHIVTDLMCKPEDFNENPFDQRGGSFKAVELFGSELTEILDELNEALAA